MKRLHISDELSLPLEFVTQTQAILAKRGVGKSYTASVEAEELLKAGQQVVVIDPTGAWFGLKSSADGKSAGFPIAVFGGEHADVPLEEHAGEVIAQAIVERRFSAIIDLSLFRKGQLCRFMWPFLETLYRLNREAMHLIVDEADALAPQKPFGEEARMLGAMEDVVRRGRRRGIGCTLITQRPQVLNKNVLTQCEIVCCLRLIHPKDIDALEEWVNVHGDPDRAKAMIASLPSLPVGTAWFWAPGFGDIFKQVHIRQRETFDSSATPKAGEIVRQPKVLAPVDIQQLGQQIQSTVQRAKENDPSALKRRITELEKQLTQRPAEAKTVIEEKIVEVSVVKPEDAAKLSDILASLQIEFSELKSVAASLSASLERAQKRPQMPTARPAYVPARPMPTPRHIAPVQPSNGHSDLSGPERKILRALSELLSIGKDQPPKNMVAAWAGYSPLGGAFGNPIGSLRSKGLIDYPQQGIVALTDEGLKAVGTSDPPDQEEIWRRIENTCSGPEQKILRALLDHAGPEPMPKEELADKAGYSPIGGAFGNPVGALRTKGLLDYPRQGVVQAAEWLFI